MFLDQKSEQSGRTFVETIAYIMVMITITVTFAAAVSRGYYKYESSLVQQQLMELKKVIADRYAADGTYEHVKWDDLCAESVGPKSLMPKRKCTSDGCGCAKQMGHHVFDGPVNIGPSDGGLTYFIEFKDLPEDICSQLGIISWNLTEGSDLDHMEINNSTWRWQISPLTGVVGSDKELPVQVQDVANACKEGYINRIKWYFN